VFLNIHVYGIFFLKKLDRGDFAFKDTPINEVELRVKVEG
jgi:hypothetical protein